MRQRTARRTATLLALAATAPATGFAATGDEAHRFAAGVARDGPRPAASEAERRVQLRVAARFRSAGLRVSLHAFRVPGLGRSRNVTGVRPGSRPCLRIVMAHSDSVPRTPGANDNGSGLGTLVELAGRLDAIAPRCEVWLVATGAEERPYTRQPDHVGALALVRLVRRRGVARRLRYALSVDEVGRGRDLVLRSPEPVPRREVEGELLAAARGERIPLTWRRDSGTGNSDHREFELAGLAGAKLGESDRCNHRPCDRAGRLDRVALGRTVRLVASVLRAG